MNQVLLFSLLAFGVGFVVAWVLQAMAMAKIRKEFKRTEGLLESERLMKEKLRKENIAVYQMKEAMESDLTKKLQDASVQNRMMDQDIILLQKHYEETEALLKAGQPVIHELKLKLIEANNTIARYKSQMGVKV